MTKLEHKSLLHTGTRNACPISFFYKKFTKTLLINILMWVSPQSIFMIWNCILPLTMIKKKNHTTCIVNFSFMLACTGNDGFWICFSLKQFVSTSINQLLYQVNCNKCSSEIICQITSLYWNSAELRLFSGKLNHVT